MSERVEQETAVGEVTVLTLAGADGRSVVQVEKRSEGLRAVVAGPFTPAEAGGAGKLHAQVTERLQKGEISAGAITEATVRRELLEDLGEEELQEALASFLGVPPVTGLALARELQSNLTVDAESFRLARTASGASAGGEGDPLAGWEVLPNL